MLLVLCPKTLLSPAVGSAAGEALLCFWCDCWGSCMLTLKVRTFNLVFIKTNGPQLELLTENFVAICFCEMFFCSFHSGFEE